MYRMASFGRSDWLLPFASPGITPANHATECPETRTLRVTMCIPDQSRVPVFPPFVGGNAESTHPATPSGERLIFFTRS